MEGVKLSRKIHSTDLLITCYKFCEGDVNALRKLIFEYPPVHIFAALGLSGSEYQSKSTNRKAGKKYSSLERWKKNWKGEGILEEKVCQNVPQDDIDKFPADATISFSLNDFMKSVTIPATSRQGNKGSRAVLSKDNKDLLITCYKFCEGDVNALRELIFEYTPVHIFAALGLSGSEYQSKSTNRKAGKYYSSLVHWKTNWKGEGILEEKVCQNVPQDDIDKFPADATISFSLDDFMKNVYNGMSKPRDEDMIAQLEEFFKNSSQFVELRHIWVPHFRRTDKGSRR